MIQRLNAQHLRAVFATVALSAVLNCVPSATAQQTSASGCRPTNPDYVADVLAYFKELVSSTDTNRVHMREALGISSASANKVSLVTRQSICNEAAEALNAHLEEPGIVRQVWVFNIGSGYAVQDPDEKGPGYDPGMFVFDRQFNYKSTINGF